MVQAFMKLVVHQRKSKNYGDISITQMLRRLKEDLSHELPTPKRNENYWLVMLAFESGQQNIPQMSLNKIQVIIYPLLLFSVYEELEMKYKYKRRHFSYMLLSLLKQGFALFACLCFGGLLVGITLLLHRLGKKRYYILLYQVPLLLF